MHYEKALCGICQTMDNAEEIYPAALGGITLDEHAFTARRIDNAAKIHFRMVRCTTCGLVRSDPRIDTAKIEELYRGSHFIYADETRNLCRTYGHYLSRVNQQVAHRGRLLDIGCGNGFFLEEAQRQGYEEVFGVEPSPEAAAQAPETIRQRITVSMFHPDLFPEQSFDVICFFQTLDHLEDPACVIADCFSLLKPGGVVFAINHNVRSISARVLGERSPIIDVGHTYLYDKKTIRKLFEKNHYTVVDVWSSVNVISFEYLLSLLPLRPLVFKERLISLVHAMHIGRVPLVVPLGNLGIIARRDR
ncbi:MAG: class I SAM-dependent methyltransferase [Candidatus Magasanikbacteria bacterium]|nr:class I SAM-dependent methyltransferase [Candidatus Magasanikbacteria bacterium]